MGAGGRRLSESISGGIAGSLTVEMHLERAPGIARGEQLSVTVHIPLDAVGRLRPERPAEPDTE